MGIFDAIGSAFSTVEQAKVAAANLQMQQQKFDYDKQLQQDIFAREDNSVERRTADLKAAGLNPVLAAGQGARAGAPIGVTAPQVSEGPAKSIGQIAGVSAQMSMTRAQTALINAQTKKTNVESERAASCF